MNLENSKTSYRSKRVLNLIDQIDLQRGDKRVAFSELIIYYTWTNIKNSHENNEFEILRTTWDKEFELSMNILNKSSRGTKPLLINHQPKYMSTKIRIELHLRFHHVLSRKYETTWNY